LTNYQHIFFDLDKTLWDYDRNSNEALVEIHSHEKLSEKYSLDVNSFIDVYNEVNILMWQYHREGKLDKEGLRSQRFILVLEQLGIKEDSLAARLNEGYMRSAMNKTNLMPHAIEILNHLFEKYKLHIITNGFEESQRHKIKNSGIDKYFTNIITCESADCTKPDRKIFEFALRAADAKRRTSLMVGDHLEVDIVGARRVGIDQAYVNSSPMRRREKVTYHVNTLLELKKIL